MFARRGSRLRRLWAAGLVALLAPALAPAQEQIPAPRPAEPAELELRLEPPSPEQLFRPESEATSRERIRREAERRNIRAVFPPDVELGPLVPLAECRGFGPQGVSPVPAALCHGPLYFEDRNTERYGWNVGALQPLVSTGKFYLDTLLLPYNLVVMPPWVKQCEGAEPLPGDPVPYLLYLPLCRRTWTFTSPAGEADVTIDGHAIFP